MRDEELLRTAEDPNLVVSLSDEDLRRLAVLRGMRCSNPSGVPRRELVGFVLGGSGSGGTRSELGGCITDTRYMNYCLCSRFRFEADQILMLNEDQRNPYQVPTHDNILRAIEWLVSGSSPGDSLVFMYSGHGDQVRDNTGEELDGMCETILPLDHQRAGPIVDKELYVRMVAPLGPGVRLFALCDSCHSGTILDLPYAFVPELNPRGGWGQSPWRPAARVFKGTSGGDAVCISGCRDDQTSADTRQLSGGQATTGAMLYSFIQCVEHGRARTYGELITSMRQTIDHALKHGVSWGALANAGIQSMIFGPRIGMVMAAPSLASAFTGGSVQVPQLSSAKEFDLRAPFGL
ncbi:type I metacaspase [Chloropicon primus]|uniref:Type I metacaspase n=1 Tax=Chloropicon primus TaxID=1764295 RepID=A0A5B8MEG7_9CHLO|nr:type I metacaspase [Chloropicon primus]|eukprot:QDZ18747.1 type I metacaspase [Chloropicon primus]